MPDRSAHPCRYQRCPHITTHKSGLCEMHRRAQYAQNDAHRGTSAERGYDSAWRRLRAQHLRANPWCVMCAQIGKAERATDVDHIVPHSGDDGLRLDRANLQSLCAWHHKSKTMKERKG
jgi:5-methylcytosine-specific restriction protein A